MVSDNMSVQTTHNINSCIPCQTRSSRRSGLADQRRTEGTRQPSRRSGLPVPTSPQLCCSPSRVQQRKQSSATFFAHTVQTTNSYLQVGCKQSNTLCTARYIGHDGPPCWGWSLEPGTQEFHTMSRSCLLLFWQSQSLWPETDQQGHWNHVIIAVHICIGQICMDYQQ